MAQQTSKFITGEVRLSYAHLFTPQVPQNGGEAKYGTAILIKKTDTKTLAKIKAAIDFVKADPASIQKWGGKVPNPLKTPVRDGDEERPDSPDYKGCYFMNASSKRKPGIIGLDGLEIFDSTEVYSGCYCRVSINLFAFSNSGNKGIGAGLNNVLKVKDGENLGGAPESAEEDFADILAEAPKTEDFTGLLG